MKVFEGADCFDGWLMGRIPDETVRKLTLAGAIGKVSWKKRRIV